MSTDVIAWLDSDEGQRWAWRTFRPVEERSHHGASRPYVQPIQTMPPMGPLDPQHDPCGRPPLERAT